MSILTDEQVTAVSKHKVSHDIGYCSCPCFAALLQVATEMPKVQAAAKVEGMLAILSTPDEEAPA